MSGGEILKTRLIGLYMKGKFYLRFVIVDEGGGLRLVDGSRRFELGLRLGLGRLRLFELER